MFVCVRVCVCINNALSLFLWAGSSGHLQNPYGNLASDPLKVSFNASGSARARERVSIYLSD